MTTPTVPGLRTPGGALEIRPTTAGDAEPIHRRYEPLSLEDRRRRFFTAFRPDLDRCRRSHVRQLGFAFEW